MAVKFKKDEKRRIKGTKKVQVTKHFIKQTPLEELMKYVNNPNGKPKIKQKCRNEVVRRGYTIEKVAVNEEGL
tara:strand:- start:901 stop:1119 length:219 start_codon:yes stop_codon:yes gene_type:complete